MGLKPLDFLWRKRDESGAILSWVYFGSEINVDTVFPGPTVFKLSRTSGRCLPG